MNRQRTLVAGLFLAGFGVVAASRDSFADEFVWARANGGFANMNRPVSALNNGYGGYYVPRNAYGNNHEGQPFTNPTGFVVPAQPAQPMPSKSHWLRRMCWWR